MRWVSYRSFDGSERCGLVEDGKILGHTAGITLLDLLRSGEGLEAAGALLRSNPAEVVDLSWADILAPIPVPPSVRDFAAFERHISNTSRVATGDPTVSPVWYEEPVFYFSNPAAIRGPRDNVAMPSRTSQWDYEVEVAAVIGDDCSDLDPDTAERHIAGYLVYCDWSARDISGREMGFVFGPSKSKDAATSLGPYLVTPDELEPHRSGKGYTLAMNGSVGGEQYGGGSWDEIHWSFGELLAHASRDTTLRAGDIIASGPVGNGCILELSEQHPYLTPGDIVRVEVEQLGAVQARVVDKTDAFVPEMTISRSIEIAAPPAAVFDVIADPRRHGEFDGSGTVGTVIAGPERLTLGAEFTVAMVQFDVPYEVTNTVLEYDENRLIAWAHPGQHRWRYELEPIEGGTRVTETCDFTTSPRGELVAASDWGRRDAEGIEKTLPRLKALVEKNRPR
ncbi:fumarylacetoacetate hydrolase family protein [Actinoplanes rectilineatus]|uniref:fumarylacetoacetate hydrolase family protein n=1 Tax=Actinoplanes rectilineatus TaxID=113571 RepID=UPI0007C7C8B6|nr:fumarylacetoacetate hydrolase family protein [Actinoplanes rectilineatus]